MQCIPTTSRVIITWLRGACTSLLADLGANLRLRGGRLQRLREAKELLDEAERQIFEISGMDKSGDAVSIADVLQSTFERIDRLREREGRLTGLATDYYDFDDMTGGLQGGELIIIAARPSMGKTTFALNLTERVSNHGAGIAFFSLEMSNQQVIQNMLCNRSQIDGSAMRKGRITDQQYKRLQEEAAKLYETPIFVDDTPGISITQLRAKARRLKQKHNISMICVDYLQLNEAESNNFLLHAAYVD